ncbi:hypothetical protein B0H34DRAFT_679271 [Crassisporium funariophilum]|nr:hypothetical protein B0H34DRAFT_679271 [Crassisporium funariophilum]
MSSSVTNPSDTQNSDAGHNASPSRKGKSKAVDNPVDEEDEEEEEEEDEEIGSDDDDDEEEDDFDEIDPSAIVGRRTRGVKVDYTSKEAIAKAGLQGKEDEESDEDVEMKD